MQNQISSEPRIVLWDLETMPDFEAIMRTGAYPGLGAWPGLTLKASITSIICFGWKVYGKGRGADCINAWDFPKRWKKSVNDDYEVVKAGRAALEGADAIITHNGKRFDFKHFQTRLLWHKLPPLPHNLKHIDLCQVAKTKLYLFNNRHNTVSEFLQGDKKIDNGGWELWYRVWKREKAAYELMTTYCKKDVTLLEENFNRLRPLINNIPNYNLFSEGDRHVCPSCGSTRLKSNGLYHSKTTIRRTYRCVDCSSYHTTDARDKLPRSL